jgi:hypothetical protein
MMVNEEKLRKTLKYVVDLLVSGEYEALGELGGGRGAPAEAIARVVREYPYRFISPPDDRLETLVYDDAVRIRGSEPAQYHVYVNLYTAEEGRSDLTLVVLLTEAEGPMYEVEILDLDVL